MAERPQKEKSRDQQSRAGELTEERGVTEPRAWGQPTELDQARPLGLGAEATGGTPLSRR